jgi:hypothetical protein
VVGAFESFADEELSVLGHEVLLLGQRVRVRNDFEGVFEQPTEGGSGACGYGDTQEGEEKNA